MMDINNLLNFSAHSVTADVSLGESAKVREPEIIIFIFEN